MADWASGEGSSGESESEPEWLSTDDEILNDVPLERLEEEITSFAGRLASSTAKWLIWIAAFDRRKGWEQWDQMSCAGWLNWKCGVSLRAAQEHVRVGRALERLPEARGLFLAGRLSYSKVRAITRVADEFSEAELCAVALESTASQLDRICAAMRSVTPKETTDWTPSVRFEIHDDHGRIVIELDPDDHRRAENTIRAAADQIIKETRNHVVKEETLVEAGRREIVDHLGGLPAILAGAFSGLVTGGIDATDGPFEDTVLITNAESLAGKDDTATFSGDHLPPLVAERLACDSRLQVGVADADGVIINLGREQRVVGRKLRRSLHHRDGGMCRFPGCGSRRRLHAHHVVHWASGGATNLGNLVLVCHFHHHALHEGGWNVVNKNGRFVFYDPNGQQARVPQLADPTPGLPLHPPVQIRGVEPRPLDGRPPLAGSGERLDLHWTVGILIDNADVRRKRSAERRSP